MNGGCRLNEPLSSETVWRAIEAIAPDHGRFFTTVEVARRLDVPEYPVRAAFAWLARRKKIEVVPCVYSTRYTKQNEKYFAACYRRCDAENGEDGAFDAALFNLLFGYAK